MLVFFEATGAFCLIFRIVFYHYSNDRHDALSEIAQYYGAIALVLTPFWRDGTLLYGEAWWYFWIVPHWPLMIAGGVLAIIYELYLRHRFCEN
jgi:hypothetical protein